MVRCLVSVLIVLVFVLIRSLFFVLEIMKKNMILFCGVSSVLGVVVFGFSVLRLVVISFCRKFEVFGLEIVN